MRRVLSDSEQQVVEQLARYMQLRHPDVLYRFDLAADLKLTVGQAARHKRLHPHRGWPDLGVYQARPRPWVPPHEVDLTLKTVPRIYLAPVHALLLELKRKGTRLKKRNGDWVNEHVAEQAACLEQLREQGYAAEFAVGLDQAIELIDNYLAGDTHEDDEQRF